MELKNTSDPAHLRGLEAELIVMKDLIRRGYTLRQHRLKTPFSEIDLLIQTREQEFMILEVKTLNQWDWIDARLSRSQKSRLKRSCQWVSSQQGTSCGLALAFVMQNQVRYFLAEP